MFKKNIIEKNINENAFDYMQYFFTTRNNSDLTTNFKKYVERLPFDHLSTISTEILSDTFGFLRHSAEFPKERDLSVEEARFYKAVVWHLTDATHNIHTHMNRENWTYLITYITDFYVFIHAYKNLHNRPSFLSIPEINLTSKKIDLSKIQYSMKATDYAEYENVIKNLNVSVKKI